MKKSRMLVIAVALSTIVVAAEAQRRGFSTSGSGSGAYDGSAATTSWDIDSSLDGDCLAAYSQVCSALSPAQYTTVKAKYDAAVAANYDSNADFETAEALGYSLTPADGTTWSSAKSANSSLETDCNDTHSGDCDAVTKTLFVEVNDGRADAIAAGYDSYSDWSDANAQGYSQNATDQAIWAEAKGNTLTAFCEAEVPGETSCSSLTKSQYQSAQNGNALMEAKIAKVTAGTLTAADLSELSLDLTTSSTLGSNPAQWKVDYLETVLATASGTNKSDWQTTINNFSLAAASQWYLYQIASSSDTTGIYAASNATTTLFENAGILSATITDLSVTNTEIQTDIKSAGWTTSPTTTQMHDFLTDATGFGSTITYANLTTAKSNGWTTANYQTASALGYTNTAADKSLWDDASGTTYTVFCQISLGDTSQSCTDMTKAAFTTSKSGVTTAITNGWSITDYTAAVQVTGSDWTNSAADEEAFSSCMDSTDGAAAPADDCDLTKAAWNDVADDLVTLAWNTSMNSTFTIASNYGPGKDESFKGCNSWWRDHIGAVKTDGTGMTVSYYIEDVPSNFTTLAVNSSNGELTYTVASQNVAAAANVTVRAKAIKNGITYANISQTVSIQAVAMLNQTDTVWRIVNSGGSSSKGTVQANLRKINKCPSGYVMATSSTDKATARNLGMNAKGGTYASTWSKPSGNSLDYCTGGPSTCNTAGVNNWSHTALVYGKSGSNSCLVFENSNKTSSYSLAPDDGTCASHTVGTSGWCVVSYICKYNGSTAKKKWPSS